jgi:hypothetical protein
MAPPEEQQDIRLFGSESRLNLVGDLQRGPAQKADCLLLCYGGLGEKAYCCRGPTPSREFFAYAANLHTQPLVETTVTNG